MRLLLALVTTLLAWSLLADTQKKSSQGEKNDSKSSQSNQAETKNQTNQNHEKDKDNHPPKNPTPPHPPNCPFPAPTHLTAAPLSEFIVELTWRDNSTNEMGFRLERSADGKNYAQIANLLPGTTYYRDLNRFPNSSYFYRVSAHRLDQQSAWSNIACTQTPATDCKLSSIGWGFGAYPPTSITNVVGIAVGQSVINYLKRDGTVSSWKLDGGGSGYVLSGPTNLSQVTAVAAGRAHCLALKTDGKVVSWGESLATELKVPTDLKSVVAIAAGSYHSLALRADGTVVAWGNNYYGQTTVPKALTGVVAIAAGDGHSLALRSDGTVVSWGTDVTSSGHKPEILTDVVAISAGPYVGLALHRNGTISSWDYQNFTLPQPPSLTNVIAVTGGNPLCHAVHADGTVTQWGYSNPFLNMPENLAGVVALSTYEYQTLALMTRPAPPAGLRAMIFATNRVALSWTNSLPRPTTIRIERSTNQFYYYPGTSPDWTTVASVSGSTSNYNDTTTVTNQFYLYRLLAFNSCGPSVSSTFARATIIPPQSPPSLYASSFANKAILQIGVADAASTSVTLERARDPEGIIEPWSVIASLSTTNDSLRYTNTGLSLDTTYWYRVREHNGLGDSPYGSPVAVTITRTVAPSYLYARVGQTNQIDLTWGVPGPGDQGGFKIERALDLDGLPVGWTQIARLTNRNARSYSDRVGLTNGIVWYRVRAFNLFGDSEDYSPWTTVELARPFRPTLSGQNFGRGVQLDWSDSYPGKVSSFQLERTTGPNGVPENWKQIARGTNANLDWGNSGTFFDRSVAAGETYRYRVKTANWLGASDYSSPISVTIQSPDTPDIQLARTDRSNSVLIAWSLNRVGQPNGIRVERAPDAGLHPGLWSEIANLTNPAPQWNYPTHYYDEHVNAGLTYWYRVRAYDAAGLSDYSEPMSVRVEPPFAVSFVEASAFGSQALLNWYFPSQSQYADGFRIERAIDVSGAPGTWSHLATLNSVAGLSPDSYYNHFTNSGLATGTYWYRVAAFNWAGQSDFSSPVSVQIHPPLLPDFVTAWMGDTQQVVLSWWSPPDVDGVEIERAPDAGNSPGSWTFIGRSFSTNQPILGYLSSMFVVTNVSANSTNWFRIRGFNAVGYSDYTSPLAVRTIPPPSPEAFTAESRGDSTLLTWFTSYDYGFVTQFELERAEDTGSGPGIWTRIGTTGGGYPAGFIYNDTGLTHSATYWYRARAVNWLGYSPYTTPVPASIALPPAPNIELARIGFSNQVVLKLTANYPYGQKGFQIDRAPDVGGSAGEWVQIGSVFAAAASSANFTDTNASAFSTNWYRARVYSSIGVSAPSAARRVDVVPPPAPYFLTATPVANRVRLAWGIDYPNYGNISGFNLERAPDQNGIPGTWARIAVTGFVSSYTNTLPVSPGNYWYRVQARNWVGEGEFVTTWQPASVSPPPQPYAVQATVGTSNRVRLIWYAANPPQQDGYRIERAPDAGGTPGTWSLLGSFLDAGYFQSFVDTAALANRTNWYRVIAFNVVGNSVPGDPVSVGLIPPPKTYLSASSFANRVHLSWRTDYASYGVVDDFELQRAPDTGNAPGTWIRLAVVPKSTGTYTDDHRTLGSTSWYRVRARNWLGVSEWSDPASATIVLPPAPQFFTALIGDTNQVQLNLKPWYPYEQDGFQIDRAAETNDAPGNWQPLAIVAATNQGEAIFMDTNALALTTNWYRARTFNGAGVSTNGEPIRIAVLPPPAPDYFYAESFADEIRLTWNSSSPNYGYVGGYKVERADDLGGTPGTWTALTNIDVTPLFPGQSQTYSFADGGLSLGATYWYRMRAYNWVGNGEPTYALRVTIVPPGQPQYLTATIGVSNSVDLRWYPPTRGDQNGYRVERAPDASGTPGVWKEVATVTNYGGIIIPGVYSPHYIDEDVVAHTHYWYRVRAFNTLGLSDYTVPVGIETVSPPEPYSLNASRFVGGLYLSWGNDNGYGIGNFIVERANDVAGNPGTWTQIAEPGWPPYQDTGLTGHTKYWYRVSSRSWVGTSAPTVPISVTALPTPEPQGLQVLLGATNRAYASWYADPSDQTGFILESAPDDAGAPGSWSALANVATNGYWATYAITNVAPLSTNWYRVRAYSIAGDSSNTPPVRLAAAPPPPPEQITASQFANRIDLFWYDYTWSDVNGFKVERAEDVGGAPGTWTEIALTPATNSFCGWWNGGYSDAGRTAETTYWYRFRAFNWVGESGYSSNVFRKIVGPKAPTGLAARIGNTNQIDLDWFPSGNDLAGYYLERATNVGGVPGQWTQIATIPTTNGFSSFTDTNFSWFSTYWYRVRSFNVVGVSPFSTPVSIGVLPPPPPSPISASSFADRAELRWQFATGNYGLIAGFKVERALDNAGAPGNWSEIQRIPANDWSYYFAVDTNLTAQASYWYRVRTYNWLGDGPYSAAYQVTITPPSAPVDLRAYPSTSEIYLYWAAAPPRDQDGFKIERSTNALSGWSEIGMTLATNSWYAGYSDTNFTPNLTNYYRVRAFNIVGKSDYSAVVAARVSLPVGMTNEHTSAPLITSLVLTNGDVLITWISPGGNSVVETSPNLKGPFSSIPESLTAGSEATVGTYLDIGARTNAVARFYRIRTTR